MAAQTFGEILSRLKDVHGELSTRLAEDERVSQDERVSMLIEYLSEREGNLKRMLDRVSESAEKEALNTWFYEYAQSNNVLVEGLKDRDYSGMSTEDIIADVNNIHEEMLNVLDYMKSAAETQVVADLVDDILTLEHQETKRIVRQAEGVEAL